MLTSCKSFISEAWYATDMSCMVKYEVYHHRDIPVCVCVFGCIPTAGPVFTLSLETWVLFKGVEQQDGEETGAKEVGAEIYE